MTHDAAEHELTEALTRLETALLTPVVSGELGSWAETCRAADDAVAEHFTRYLEEVLHRQYAEIARSDEELLQRVQQMKAEDQSLAADLAAYQKRLTAFAEAAALIKKHESKVDEERTALEKDGIDLIVRIRKQRAAADLWLTEAVYRDRGAVD